MIKTIDIRSQAVNIGDKVINYGLEYEITERKVLPYGDGIILKGNGIGHNKNLYHYFGYQDTSTYKK